PASRHRRASEKWADTGVATAAASSGNSRSWSTEPTVGTWANDRRTASSRAGLASQTAATSTAGQARKFRNRFGPQYPYPMMATRVLVMARKRGREKRHTAGGRGRREVGRG